MRAALPLLLALPCLDAFAGMGRIHRTRHVAARTAVSPIAAADPAADASPSTDDAPADGEIITFTDGAMTQLVSLREKQGADQLNVRMGVRAGGCSGMSYVMDVMDASKPIDEADTVIEFDQARRHRRHPARVRHRPAAPHPPTHSAQGIRCVIDPKSIMFLYGLKLDYSDALIGGGFSFHNPNADSTCGCGTSFAV